MAFSHLLRHLVLDLRVVGIGVEQDDGVCQHIRHISALEGVRIAADVAFCKLLHESVDLLRLSWEPEA